MGSAARITAESRHRGLFDHLVGDLLEMHWHVEAQRFSRFDIDDKLKRRRRLHW